MKMLMILMILKVFLRELTEETETLPLDETLLMETNISVKRWKIDCNADSYSKIHINFIF